MSNLLLPTPISYGDLQDNCINVQLLPLPRDPTVNDKYLTGTFSINLDNGNAWQLSAYIIGVPQWTYLGGGASLAHFTLPNTAIITPVSGNINFVNGANVSITGSGNNIIVSAETGSQAVHYTPVNHSMSPYVVQLSDYYLGVTTNGGAVTIQLPNDPATGTVYIVKDSAGDSEANAITVTTIGGVVNIDASTSLVIEIDYKAVQFIFNGSSWEAF